jgi:nitroreductase
VWDKFFRLMDVRTALTGRKSIRAFLDKPVSEAQVRDLLTLASKAPSGGNLQPWQVHVVSGNARDKVIDAVKQTQSNQPFGEATAEYQIYPKPLPEPWRTRRFECGEAMYGALNIERSDKMSRLVHLAGNFEFWGASVGIFLSIHKDMQPGQWADLGMFLQSFMLAATEAGLATCAQESWSLFPQTVKNTVGIEGDHILFCGLALGYADPDAPVNSTQTSRADLDEIAVFAGFDQR